jgi:tetratricopeptide (TPR) repeat protein
LFTRIETICKIKLKYFCLIFVIIPLIDQDKGLRQFFTIAFLFFALTATWGQSNEDVSFIKRAYHNTTARYNGYYHAELRINQALKQLKSTVQLDYTERLPLYPYYDAEEVTSISADMDEVVKKTSKVIKKHKISKWIDDCYLMLGQAYFLKNDYENAKKSFVYVTTKYKREAPKKERYLSGGEKTKRSLNKTMSNLSLKHEPAYFDAGLWLSHSHIEMEGYDKAQTVLDLMRSKKHFPPRLEAEALVIQTHIHLAQKDIKKAVDSLQKSIEKTEERKRKAHLTFILGQLYQEIGEHKSAINAYEQVLELRPPYEMEFYAKINMAKVYRDAGNLPMSSIKQQLKALAKDEKNEEYLDQIYYLLGQLNLQEQDTLLAINYFQKSAHSSMNNETQKAKSYLQLADLHFAQQKYRTAKYYYDSTMTALPQDYEKYEAIKEREETLDKLIKNILIVERQDSLLYLASLPESEREEIIDQKVEAKKKALREAQRQNKPSKLSNNTQKQGYNMGGSGKWYFYNSNLKEKGKKAFVAKWGDRPLEDNWRRSSKSNQYQAGQQGTASQNPAAQIDRQQFIEPIPLAQAEKDSSRKKIIDALFQIGVIYREGLQNFTKSINTFEKLNRQYENHHYLPTTYFYLYRLYKRIGNEQKAAHYKELILTDYPNSELALHLQNPQAQNGEPEEQNHEAEKLYESTYQTYKTGAYNTVIAACQRADSLYPEDPLLPKFSFLEALSYGQQRDISAFKTKLEKIIENHPGTPQEQKAQRILNHLDERNLSKILEQEADTSSIYAYSPREEHYLVTILNPDINQKSSQLNIIFSNFNKKYFGLQDLQVSNLMLDGERNMILIKGLKNAKKGKKYLKQIKEHGKLNKQLKPEQREFLLMSKTNFQLFYKEKEINQYQTFYTQHYVNN